MSPKALNKLYAGVKIVVGEVVVKLDICEFTMNTRSEANTTNPFLNAESDDLNF